MRLAQWTTARPLIASGHQFNVKSSRVSNDRLYEAVRLSVLSITDTLVSSRTWLFAEFLSKQRRRNIAEARVVPLAVIKAFDVFLYCGFGVAPGRVTLMVHQLAF